MQNYYYDKYTQFYKKLFFLFAEIITISHHMDSFPLDGSDNQFFKLTLFLEKNQTYLCFTKKWRLVTMVSNNFIIFYKIEITRLLY